MKKLILALGLFITTLGLSKADVLYDVDFNYFYHTLTPYGEWISLDADVVVWRPTSIQVDWRPYSIGRWSWTADGWYWDSYEPFGWATYHYGRWFYDDYYGWVWMPDYNWGPAWVEWRYDDNYIGWAPLPPYASFNADFGIHFSINWRSPYRYWNFVSYGHFCNPYVHHHFIHYDQVPLFFSHTKYRTNYYMHKDRVFNGGVHRRLIEKRGGYSIREREITRANTLDDYRISRDRNDDVIRAFRPEGKELERYNGQRDVSIRHGDNRSGIDRDKIVISGRNRNVDLERNTNQDNEARSNSRVDRNNGNSNRFEQNSTSRNSSRNNSNPRAGNDREERNNTRKIEIRKDNNRTSTPRATSRSNSGSNSSKPNSTSRNSSSRSSSSSGRTKSRK